MASIRTLDAISKWLNLLDFTQTLRFYSELTSRRCRLIHKWWKDYSFGRTEILASRERVDDAQSFLQKLGFQTNREFMRDTTMDGSKHRLVMFDSTNDDDGSFQPLPSPDQAVKRLRERAVELCNDVPMLIDRFSSLQASEFAAAKAKELTIRQAQRLLVTLEKWLYHLRRQAAMQLAIGCTAKKMIVAVTQITVHTVVTYQKVVMMM